jgi:TPP-dependent pyruvate/acetoin dehydrogenase alpha subunit
MDAIAAIESSANLDMPARLAMFRQMVELRLFENKAYDLFLLGLVKGTTHLAQGQEAVAVGFAAATTTRSRAVSPCPRRWAS